MQSFRNSGDCLSQSDLQVFEGHLGVRLPADYRDFLLIQNGGVPSDAFFICRELGVEPEDELWIEWFCIVDQFSGTASLEADFYSIAHALACYRDIVPSEMIPIGLVCRDYPLLLSVSGDHYGSVHMKYLFALPTLSRGDWRKNPQEAVLPIAESFEALLRMLHEERD